MKAVSFAQWHLRRHRARSGRHPVAYVEARHAARSLRSYTNDRLLKPDLGRIELVGRQHPPRLRIEDSRRVRHSHILSQIHIPAVLRGAQLDLVGPLQQPRGKL